MIGRYLRKRRRKAARSDETSVGNILLERGQITREQLDAVLARQDEQDRLLCELLMDDGAITEWQARDALAEQRIRRNEAKPQEVLKVQQSRNVRLARMLAGHK